MPQTKRLNIDDFLSRTALMPVLDVRTLAEYEKGHIPGAVSFPLFTNEERAIVGTLYVRQGRQTAIMKALEIIGPKLSRFVEEAEALHTSRIALYCWRGGMRSGSMAWLLETYGLKTITLEGGYKAYRKRLAGFFEKPLPLCVTTGYTGSGKTDLLKALKRRKAQVVDLEELAHHRGSSYGNVESEWQPATEMFQNLVFEEFRKMDLQKPIWIEDESIRIGKVWLPEGLFKQIGRRAHVMVEVEKEQRAAYLAEQYGRLSNDKLIGATRAISKNLGGDKAGAAVRLIEEGKMKEAAAIILHYYDTMYRKSIEQKRNLIIMRIEMTIDGIEAMAEKLGSDVDCERLCIAGCRQNEDEITVN